MPTIDIPFNTNGKEPGEKGTNHELIQTLPEAFREACEKNKHLADYVSLIPVEEIDRNGLKNFDYRRTSSNSYELRPKESGREDISDLVFTEGGLQ